MSDSWCSGFGVQREDAAATLAASSPLRMRLSASGVADGQLDIREAGQGRFAGFETLAPMWRSFGLLTVTLQLSFWDSFRGPFIKAVHIHASAFA
jgi:hypothetical protein